GVVLNDSSIISFANAETHFTFQEDRSIFRVSQIDVDTERFTQDNRPRAPYTTDMIGLAEWSLHDPLDMFLNRRGSNWSAVYRDIAGSSMFGHILVAHLMGVTELWNYPPVFEYMDRFARVEVPFTLDPTLTRPQQYYVPNSATGGHPWQTNRIQPFFAHMWQEYVW
ncbi:MAG: hypothetical protein FWC10_09975, partial [Lentimicrobiaceae bacterium]|nr:hypothetical protein [Lentimicrobiaceae bacterium]